MKYTSNHESGLLSLPALLYGRVLVLGLGKGGGVQRLLRFPSIHRMVVVDNDPEVIANYHIPDERVTIVEADAADYYQNNHMFFDFVCQDLSPRPLPGSQWLKTPAGVTTWVSV